MMQAKIAHLYLTHFIEFMAFNIINVTQPEDNLLCPYCHHAVLNWEEEQYLQPCDHTLFIAMDLGFEYISDAFEATMNKTVDEIHANDDITNVIDEIKQSSLESFEIYKADLGVEGYYRYTGFAA